MTILFALFFGLGLAAFTYTRMGRHTGFSNSQSLWTVVGVVFVLSTVMFWTVLWTLGIK